MDKRKTHHIWTKVRVVHPAYFLAIAAVSGTVCVLALRSNNQHMITLRDAVYVADKQGNDVQAPLQKLQAYVTTHMNTDLSAAGSNVYPPIQLKYTYDRLVKAQSDEAAAANSQLYTAAQHYCEQQNSADFSGRNRVPCIEQYVQEHDSKLVPIQDSLYKFAFVSPRWSADLAGWSMLIAFVSGVLFAVTLLLRLWFRHVVR